LTTREKKQHEQQHRRHTKYGQLPQEVNIKTLCPLDKKKCKELKKKICTKV